MQTMAVSDHRERDLGTFSLIRLLINTWAWCNQKTLSRFRAEVCVLLHE